ncbi:MAG: HKD family nuclease [Cyclobacteriaceae bacterium]|jgi:HKD family nuclease
MGELTHYCMPVDYITHNGRKILYVNLQNIKDKPTVLQNLEHMVKAYQETTVKIYLLLDVRGTFTDPEIMDRLKTYGKNVFNGKSEKRAVLGVDGLKKLLMKAYVLFTKTEVRACSTEEEAKDYLAS